MHAVCMRSADFIRIRIDNVLLSEVRGELHSAVCRYLFLLPKLTSYSRYIIVSLTRGHAHHIYSVRVEREGLQPPFGSAPDLCTRYILCVLEVCVLSYS